MNPSSVLSLTTNTLAAVEPLPNGAIRIGGWLTKWSSGPSGGAGPDLTNDHMVRGAFLDDIPRFLSEGSQPLLYHHRPADVIGRVEHLDETAEGVRLTAVISYQKPFSPWRYIYDAVLDRRIRGLSVGARFDRRERADGHFDIVRARIFEASITPVPALPSAEFQIIGKGAPVGGPPTFDQIKAAMDALGDRDIDLALLEAKVLELRARALLA